jgi:hypothetical protein
MNSLAGNGKCSRVGRTQIKIRQPSLGLGRKQNLVIGRKQDLELIRKGRPMAKSRKQYLVIDRKQHPDRIKKERPMPKPRNLLIGKAERQAALLVCRILIILVLCNVLMNGALSS